MRIGVVSDTHGSLSTAIKLIREMGELDLLLHAGDYYRDAAALAREFNLPVRAVVGNCDLAAKGRWKNISNWQAGGFSYAMGTVTERRSSPYFMAQEMGPLVVFGHTTGRRVYQGHQILTRHCRGAWREGLVTAASSNGWDQDSIIASREAGSWVYFFPPPP